MSALPCTKDVCPATLAGNPATHPIGNWIGVFLQFTENLMHPPSRYNSERSDERNSTLAVPNNSLYFRSRGTVLFRCRSGRNFCGVTAWAVRDPGEMVA